MAWYGSVYSLLTLYDMALQHLKAGGGTYYGRALKKAFEYFLNTADNDTVSGQQRGELAVN